MDTKKLYLLLGSIGSVIGGWLPTLFGAGDLSGWSILGGVIGGIAGIYLGTKLV
jgi:hypothetical protein